MSQVGNRLLRVIQINQLWARVLSSGSLWGVFLFCVCVKLKDIKKNCHWYIHTEMRPSCRTVDANSLCQKMDCYHQYHMELIISKELQCQVIHNTAPKWNNVLFFLWSVKGASKLCQDLSDTINISLYSSYVLPRPCDIPEVTWILKSLVLSFLLVICLCFVK